MGVFNRLLALPKEKGITGVPTIVIKGKQVRKTLPLYPNEQKLMNALLSNVVTLFLAA
jgi:hypothetical protein